MAGTHDKRSVATTEVADGPGHLAHYTTVLGVAFALLAFLDLPWYINTALLPALQPKLFYFAMALAALPVFLVRGAAAMRYAISPFGLWLIALCALNVVHWAASIEPGAQPIIASRIQVLILMFGVSFILVQADRDTLHRSLVWIALLLAVLTLLDFLAPNQFYPQAVAPVDPHTGLQGVEGRAGATLGNPNKAGESLVLLLLLAMPLRGRRISWLLTGLIAAAVLVTASRSSIVAMAMVMAAGFALALVPRLALVLMAAAAAMLIASPEILTDYLFGRADLGFGNIDNLLERFGSLVGGDLSDDSSSERFLVLAEGWQLFLDNPLAGAGAAATSLWAFPVSVHNQAVLMLAEYGLPGGLLWLSMLAMPFAGLRHSGSWATAVLGSLTVLLFSAATHNMLDFNYWLAALALMAAGLPPAPVYAHVPSDDVQADEDTAEPTQAIEAQASESKRPESAQAESPAS